MRRLLMTAAALAALTVGAHAADLPLKAPPAQAASTFLTYNGSGAYWGIGTSSKVADSSVNGNVFATNLISSNLMAAGQTIDGEVGYIWGNASVAGFANWFRVYASGSYENISGGVSVPGNSAAVASRWSAQQGVDVNADVVQMIFTTFGWTNPFAGFQPPTPPGNLSVAATPRQYVGAFITEVGLDGHFGQASGTSWALAGGARTGFLWQLLNASGKPNGMALDMGAQVSWMPKGITFSNVFANGTPVAVNASVNQGTTYALYTRILF